MEDYAYFPTKPISGEDGVNRVGFQKIATKDLTEVQSEIVALLKDRNISPETANKIGRLLREYYQNK